MKKQILFVDDDPNILNGFRRTFRSQCNEWNMHFALSGAEALEILELHKMDLVISDMRMSGMNGTELLRKVMMRRPEAIRMILSGHADADLIMNSQGVAHQFIAKPCEPPILSSIIRRALESNEILCDEKMKKLLSGIGTLPSLPVQYIKIANELQNSETSIQRVGRIIACDPAMTAKVLQMANSAFFGLQRRLSNAEEAVTYLGIDRIQQLVLIVHAFSQFRPPQESRFSIDLLWEHSLSTAALAKTISSKEGWGKKDEDTAYTAGLLHDIGLLILASRLSEPHARAVDLAASENIPLHAAEQEILSTTHAEIGGCLFSLWNLPEYIVEATMYHHAPSQMKKDGSGILAAIHAADCRIDNRCYPDVPNPRPDKEYLSRYIKNGFPAEYVGINP
ncbi:MAG TPA: response regulator [Acidobacteriota bacterium]|nr:response regulator [Acidobacteriota bacterium]